MGHVAEGLGEVCECRSLGTTCYIQVVCLYTINCTSVAPCYTHNVRAHVIGAFSDSLTSFSIFFSLTILNSLIV